MCKYPYNIKCNGQAPIHVSVSPSHCSENESTSLESGRRQSISVWKETMEKIILFSSVPKIGVGRWKILRSRLGKFGTRGCVRTRGRCTYVPTLQTRVVQYSCLWKTQDGVVNDYGKQQIHNYSFLETKLGEYVNFALKSTSICLGKYAN